MNPSSKSSVAEPAASKGSGCLPYAAVLSFLILVLLTGAAVILVIKPMNLMKYGLTQTLEQVESKLGRERTLSAEQYQELKTYVAAGKQFLATQDLKDRANLTRASLVIAAFRQALRDNAIDREELAAIRSAVWRANIPLPVQTGKPSEKR